jgi:nucleotide-binding universal stress UspA family protein
MRPIRKILVATDFSEIAHAATLAAGELARTLGAELLLVHAYQPPAYIFPDGSTFVASAGVLTQIESTSRAALDDLARELTGLRVQTCTELGVAWERICDVARTADCDLIVVGTHGRTGLRRAVLGSVAEKVVRHADRPVLTIPAHA